MKTCKSCQKTLPISSFGNNKAAKDGKMYSCKECTNKYQRSRTVHATKPPLMKGDLKLCPICKKYLPLHRYHSDKKTPSGKSSYCKDCSYVYYRSRNPNREQTKQTILRCPDCNIVVSKRGRCLACKKSCNKRKVILAHGLSIEQYNRIRSKQNDTCCLCGEGNRRLVIDHDHLHCPGAYGCAECFRGLICAQCNQALGLVNDNIDVLKAMIRYLSYAQGICCASSDTG